MIDPYGELLPWDEQPDNFELEPECCLIARATGESHYHCARCDEVTGMFGHYDHINRVFTCEEEL